MAESAPSIIVDAVESFVRALHLNLQQADLESLATKEWTLSQARTVMVLARTEGPLPLKDLAARLQLSVAATGRNVDQLVAQDLVNREEDGHDRRIKRVSLSARGRKQVAHVHAAKRGSIAAFLGQLEPEEQSRLLAALTPILARLTAAGALREPAQ